MVRLFLALLLVFTTAYADTVINEQGVSTQSFRVESDTYDGAICVSANSDEVYLMRNGQNEAVLSVNATDVGILGGLRLKTGNKFVVGVQDNPTATVHIRVNSPADSQILKIESANSGDPLSLISMSGYRGTIQSPSASQANDILSGLSGGGFGSANPSGSGKGGFFVKAGEAWTDSSQGTYLYFETTPTGSTTQGESARIHPGGMFQPFSSSTTPNAWPTGGMFFNTATNALSIYNGTNWITLTTSN